MIGDITSPAPQAVRLADYRPPVFLVEEVELTFQLEPEATIVRAVQRLRRQDSGDLVLDGEDLETLSVSVDGHPLPPESYRIDATSLAIAGLPAACTLETVTRINPRANTQLMGLYVSGGVFCTQCEAEGFRRITWFQDRPDVMSRFKVRIEADKAGFPVLLSNGNPVGSGDLPNGRHFALWHDPFPKPVYLFALVAGDLACLEDSFITRSGRKVALRIYASAADIGQCDHAMASLKHSMKWDEDTFGLEYDLDLFMIVAVGDFNFGAMENKGLNIFNTSATLARRDTATDADFVSVERIIAHEYFHNWTGDRVTCRDWFQLTLKEGLTVFRDQQFTADRHSAPVKRISDVALLRDSQFTEDSGPLAHPIRPDQYVEINNFYTRTVYEKGAEVIRMIHTLIGPAAFRKGMDLYFERHDGRAVTCEDFVAAMADASGRDFTQFMEWYRNAGTPVVEVRREWDPATGSLTLELSQTTPPTPGQPSKPPLHMPIRMGLVSRSGRALPVQLAGENEPQGTDRVIELTRPVQRFTFIGLDEEPVPSLLRGFSAPVRLDAGHSDEELALLLAEDEDAFNRWEAGQTLALRELLALVAAHEAGQPLVPGQGLIRAFGVTLDRAGADPAFAARALSLPSTGFLAQAMPVIRVEAIAAAQRALRTALGSALAERWQATYDGQAETGPFSIEPAAMGRRALRNVALAYLGWAGQGGEATVRQYREAGNMTDRLAALRVACDTALPERDELLADFYAAWQGEPLVVNKWFALQASTEDEAAADRVAALTRHPAFTLKNPNRVRAVLATFATANLLGFHRRDGAGYRLLTDLALELDRLNPSVAARLLTSLGRWRRFDEKRQGLMKAELERVLAMAGLSRDSFEIASKSLG
ncbi:MAG TPA: aminopeptidase N [Geminicoccaceae bacterium]|nr:aminopeptidase N [Geminicoccaceae bacterium]